MTPALISALHTAKGDSMTITLRCSAPCDPARGCNRKWCVQRQPKYPGTGVLRGRRAAAGKVAKLVRGERTARSRGCWTLFRMHGRFFIIREPFRHKTFEAFRSSLEIPRATLTDRLES